MKGLENPTFVLLLVIANLIAILQIIAAAKAPRIARVSFLLLFSWACWINWKTSQQSPELYLEYAGLAWSKWYRHFIDGWFSRHIKLAVGFIATCQGLIATSMLFKGLPFKIGCIGAIIFLVAILPLGIGAGFPSTALMAVAVYMLFRQKTVH